jgi:hypothetical protein
MAWPPPDLPQTFDNATASTDIHPTAHNTTNQYLNDDYRPQIQANIGDIATNATLLANFIPGSSAAIRSNGGGQPIMQDDAGGQVSRLYGTRGPYWQRTNNVQSLTAGMSALTDSTHDIIPAVDRAGYAIITASFDFAGKSATVLNVCQGEIQVQSAGGAWAAIGAQIKSVFQSPTAEGRASVACVGFLNMTADTTYRFRLAAEELGGDCESGAWTGSLVQVFT